MPLDLTVLYRGPLSSCNYECDYCPFAKHFETANELQADRESLKRLVKWCETQVDFSLHILFTPWGEALVRHWYRQAIVRLSHLATVKKVAVQTNLSCDLRWLDEANRERVGLWCTYHPTQTTRERFVAQCQQLSLRGVRYSVGVVGVREHFAELESLRRELPRDVYLWVNAYKDVAQYYQPGEEDWLRNIDPWFPINNQRHPSRGRDCRAGHAAISVDGDGTVRRCHFIRQPLGNLYTDDLKTLLQPRPCTNETCGCYIGYIHLPELNQRAIFGEQILERVPLDWPPGDSAKTAQK